MTIESMSPGQRVPYDVSLPANGVHDSLLTGI